jgi:glycosyltransferase involved in cell wall biosynthesis
MREPLVSILIPAFNAQDWIAATIASALQQSWPNKEIIVVDDGSKDQTFTIAQQFSSRGVKVVTQPNQGASGARNAAFSMAKGDYIQWFDADDLLAPDKIERQMAVVAESKSKRTLLSGAWGYFFYRPAKATFCPTSLWCDLSPTEWLMRKMVEGIHMQPDTWLVSRELTLAAGPWDTRLWRDNDGEYFCRVILASDSIRFVPEARSYYRKAGSSSVSFIGLSNKKMDSLFMSMKLHVGYLLSLEDSLRTRAACVTYINNWVPNFYPQRKDIVSQLGELATSLGGQLKLPEFSWKYAWIEKLFGAETAKKAQIYLPQVKENFQREWDRAMFRRENHAAGSNSGRNAHQGAH